MKVIQQAVHLVIKETKDGGIEEPVALIVRLNGNPRPIVYGTPALSADEIANLIEHGTPDDVAHKVMGMELEVDKTMPEGTFRLKEKH